jgi:hypothetical protein
VTLLMAFFNWGISSLSLVIIAVILRELSKRLGQALHLKKYYLLYDVGVLLLLVAMAAMIVEIMVAKNELVSALWRILFFAGALLIVGATVRYWAWVIPEVLATSKK